MLLECITKLDTLCCHLSSCNHRGQFRSTPPWKENASISNNVKVAAGIPMLSHEPHCASIIATVSFAIQTVQRCLWRARAILFRIPVARHFNLRCNATSRCRCHRWVSVAAIAHSDCLALSQISTFVVHWACSN